MERMLQKDMGRGSLGLIGGITMDLNQWSVIGRLTRDAEGKMLPSGTFVANFSIACESGWGTKKQVNFWKVRYFGNGASAIHQWLTKGKQVAISGRGQVEKYEYNGVMREETVIIANDIQLLASPGGATANTNAPNPPTQNHGELEDGSITF